MTTGTRDARSATARRAWSRAAVGTVSSDETCGANGWTTPPTTPLASPHIVSGAASGTATRFAGNDTSGIEPNTGISTGATPICRGGGDAEHLAHPLRDRGAER